MIAQEITNRINLAAFGDATPLGEMDRAFVAEVTSVLERYGNQDRFGLCLLHDHFPMAGDEILLETHDKAARTLHVESVKRSAIGEYKPTMWHLSRNGVIELQGCAQDKCK